MGCPPRYRCRGSPLHAGCPSRAGPDHESSQGHARSNVPRRVSRCPGRFTETLLMRMNLTGVAGSTASIARHSLVVARVTRSRGCPKTPFRLMTWPRHEITASQPRTLSRSSASLRDSRSASTTVSLGFFATPAGSLSADLTMARTLTPRPSSCCTTLPPVRPVPPTRSTVRSDVIGSPPLDAPRAG